MLSNPFRKRLLMGTVDPEPDTTKVSTVAGVTYEPYRYSKPVWYDDIALRSVTDKRGNHVRQEFMNGYTEKDGRQVMFEEFSTPAGAEGGLLDKWGIRSDLFISQKTAGYLAYIDESRTWARWYDWPDGFPLKQYRNERFGWELVPEMEDGFRDIEETDPCLHDKYATNGFCMDCGGWILDTLPDRPKDR